MEKGEGTETLIESPSGFQPVLVLYNQFCSKVCACNFSLFLHSNSRIAVWGAAQLAGKSNFIIQVASSVTFASVQTLAFICE